MPQNGTQEGVYPIKAAQPNVELSICGGNRVGGSVKGECI